MTENPAAGAARTAAHRAASGLRRSVARLAAVQALYQIEMSDSSAEAVLDEFLNHRLAEELDGLRLAAADKALFGELVRGVAAEGAELDDMLAAVLDEGWAVERLETLLRIVMRAGAYELSRRPGVPARVVVSEYVDLSDAFFGGKEPGLVNGVLDSLARSLRPEEFAGGG